MPPGGGPIGPPGLPGGGPIGGTPWVGGGGPPDMKGGPEGGGPVCIIVPGIGGLMMGACPEGGGAPGIPG